MEASPVVLTILSPALTEPSPSDEITIFALKNGMSNERKRITAIENFILAQFFHKMILTIILIFCNTDRMEAGAIIERALF